MTATCILRPTRVEAVGTTNVLRLNPVAGFGQMKDAHFTIKVHGVKGLATTQVGLAVNTSPDGDAVAAKFHSTPITPQVVLGQSFCLMGYCDTDRAGNGPFSEFLHPDVIISGTAADQWAVVEVFVAKKPT